MKELCEPRRTDCALRMKSLKRRLSQSTLRLLINLAQSVVALSSDEKCGLKYVIHSFENKKAKYDEKIAGIQNELDKLENETEKLHERYWELDDRVKNLEDNE